MEEADAEEEEDDENPWAVPSHSATNVANVASTMLHPPEKPQPNPEVRGPKRRNSRRFKER